MAADETGPRDPLPTAGVVDTGAAVAEIVVPTLAKGVIIRRPSVVAMAEKLDLDGRAVHRMQTLRERYGDGPLLLAIPGRNQALILSAQDAQRVLRETPHPFSPASAEKRAALAHLEPRVSLISEGIDRKERKAFNDEVLDSQVPVHCLAAAFMAVVEEEVATLLDGVGPDGDLDWDAFVIAWYAIVRRVVVGRAARDDHELTDMLATLRGAANWAFLHPGRKTLLREFHERVDAHLARAEEGSLAAIIARRRSVENEAPSDQVAHWFFAFDPAGMATFRALALLAAHPEQAGRAREEVRASGSGEGRARLPFLRNCILESLRLWPTTPVILRESTQETHWRTGVMPANTSIILFSPFFHRDDQNLPYAHAFAPDVWVDRADDDPWPLVPFSGGPGICPARHLVPMLGAATLAAILERRSVTLKDPARLDPAQPMPGTLDNYSLVFTLQEG